ncbi:hypothetical protein GGR42_003017 [Saonia flava]|uniref:Uncharacterized protein n=1 Tax=Saonia flava TaxID=523696 RepID=A0A846QU94_9FLAO|nr:hypothetical protein [Saonia flava]
MSPFLAIKTYRLGLYFYRFFLMPSILVFILFSFGGASIFAIVVSKVILFGLGYFLYFETTRQQKIVFYKNFGISKEVLFLSILFIDLSIFVPIYYLMKLF